MNEENRASNNEYFRVDLPATLTYPEGTVLEVIPRCEGDEFFGYPSYYYFKEGSVETFDVDYYVETYEYGYLTINAYDIGPEDHPALTLTYSDGRQFTGLSIDEPIKVPLNVEFYIYLTCDGYMPIERGLNIPEDSSLDLYFVEAPEESTCTFFDGAGIQEPITLKYRFDKNEEWQYTELPFTVTRPFGTVMTYSAYTSDHTYTTWGEDTITFNDEEFDQPLWLFEIRGSIEVDLNGGMFADSGETTSTVLISSDYIIDDLFSMYLEANTYRATPPEGKAFKCFTSVRNDLSTEVASFDPDLYNTVYVYWQDAEVVDVTFNVEGLDQGDVASASGVYYKPYGFPPINSLTLPQTLHLPLGTACWMSALCDGYEESYLSLLLTDPNETVVTFSFSKLEPVNMSFDVDYDSSRYNPQGTPYMTYTYNDVELTTDLPAEIPVMPNTYLYDVSAHWDNLKSSTYDQMSPETWGESFTFWVQEFGDIIIDLNGGTYDGSYEQCIVELPTYRPANIDEVYAKLPIDYISPPEEKTLRGFTTVKDDESTLVSSFVAGAGNTYYAYWQDAEDSTYIVRVSGFDSGDSGTAYLSYRGIGTSSGSISGSLVNGDNGFILPLGSYIYELGFEAPYGYQPSWLGTSDLFLEPNQTYTLEYTKETEEVSINFGCYGYYERPYMEYWLEGEDPSTDLKQAPLPAGLTYEQGTTMYVIGRDEDSDARTKDVETVVFDVNRYFDLYIAPWTDVTIDLNGGETPDGDTSVVYTRESVLSYGEFDLYQELIGNNVVRPTGKTYKCFTTVKDDESTKIDSPVSPADVDTVYVMWQNEETMSIQLSAQGLDQGDTATCNYDVYYLGEESSYSITLPNNISIPLGSMVNFSLSCPGYVDQGQSNIFSETRSVLEIPIYKEAFVVYDLDGGHDENGNTSITMGGFRLNQVNDLGIIFNEYSIYPPNGENFDYFEDANGQRLPGNALLLEQSETYITIRWQHTTTIFIELNGGETTDGFGNYSLTLFDNPCLGGSVISNVESNIDSGFVIVPQGKQFVGLTTVVNDESTMISDDYEVSNTQVFFAYWEDIS